MYTGRRVPTYCLQEVTSNTTDIFLVFGFTRGAWLRLADDDGVSEPFVGSILQVSCNVVVAWVNPKATKYHLECGKA